MQSLPNMKLGRYYLLKFGFYLPLFDPKINCCPYLALLTYIYHCLHICGLTLLVFMEIFFLHFKEWGIQKVFVTNAAVWLFI